MNQSVDTGRGCSNQTVWDTETFTHHKTVFFFGFSQPLELIRAFRGCGLYKDTQRVGCPGAARSLDQVTVFILSALQTPFITDLRLMALLLPQDNKRLTPRLSP